MTITKLNKATILYGELEDVKIKLEELEAIDIELGISFEYDYDEEKYSRSSFKLSGKEVKEYVVKHLIEFYKAKRE